MESVRLDINHSKLISGSFSSYLRGREGTRNLLDTGVNGLIAFNKDNHSLFLYGLGSIYKSDHSVQSEQLLLHLRYNYPIYKHLYSDIFIQSEADRFIDLRERLLFGYGVRFDYKIKEISLKGGTSYMPELDIAKGGDYNVYSRWNNYLSFVHHTKINAIILSTYIQPKISNFNNIRFLEMLSVKWYLTNNLSNENIISYRYEVIEILNQYRSEIQVKNGFSWRW